MTAPCLGTHRSSVHPPAHREPWPRRELEERSEPTALGLEDARKRELLPLFRRGGADQAFQGYEAQLEQLEAESGIRQQL